jgi:hypothetical protein
MDYSTLSLVELKQEAKGRKIKQYYIMKRVQLIQLLSMEKLPTALIVEKMTITQLRDEARRKGLRGFWTLRRDALMELLFPDYINETPADKYEKNHGKTEKHDNPKNHNSKDVRVEDVEDTNHEGF